MTKKVLKYMSWILLAYVLVCLVTPFNKTLRNRSIKNQINYLSQLLDKGYDDRLQARFPEGKLFSNCLLALSIIEYCEKNDAAASRYGAMVDKCISRIQSKKALQKFNPDLTPALGMFYQGWSQLVYSSYKESALFRFSNNQEEIVQRVAKTESMFTQLQADSLRIMNSYPESNWPADNLIGIAAMQSESLRMKWIGHLMKTTEHASGLIHHSGSDKHVIRGSSSAMITYCLDKSRYPKSQEYNDKFLATFVDSYLGVQLVKENEDGSDNMDVDSGPVLFGYGASATIMNIKTQASLGNPNARITWAAMNLISAPVNLINRKFLLLKQEPMLDLFMLWASTDL